MVELIQGFDWKTSVWWLFVDQQKNVLPLKLAVTNVQYSYIGTHQPISEENVLKCFELLFEHLGAFLTKVVVRGEVYLKKKGNFSVTQVTQMLQDVEEKYLQPF